MEEVVGSIPTRSSLKSEAYKAKIAKRIFVPFLCRQPASEHRFLREIRPSSTLRAIHTRRFLICSMDCYIHIITGNGGNKTEYKRPMVAARIHVAHWKGK